MPHDHHHKASSNLKLVFFLNLGFTILEFIGGYYVNSVAIISDAVHDLGDSLSLGTSWYLQHKSQQQADKRYSFGYRRFSLMGAMINSLVLVLGSAYVIYEAIMRILHPESSDAQGMILFALVGVAVNGFAAWKLSKGKSMNERVISWHLIEDVLGWAVVLVVAVILYFYDNLYLDPALSLVITLYILYNVFKRLRETSFLFLQGVPADVDLELIKTKILALAQVDSLHHTHLWSQDGEHHVFSSHVRVTGVSSLTELAEIKQKIIYILQGYAFEHITLEMETLDKDCSVAETELQKITE
ncbi:cation diffusion facilitator family transporter [Nonlabens xiamenensis]|uniref:cation diffusion facilitator family transporter n=1 Tax=Nonlabens xiamenensis TaxID=2341043 RepID=UPI000F614221|nr:cation diffusion facilitator family transporter [Nonlabens xiamenensis]